MLLLGKIKKDAPITIQSSELVIQLFLQNENHPITKPMSAVNQ